jgi:hypothetical protein
MSDVIREQLIRLIYEKDKLDEIHDDCTKDEFVTRVFKGRIDDIGFNTCTFYYSFFGMWYPLIHALVDFCEKNDLEMDIHGSKEYQRAYLHISKKVNGE